MPAAKKPTRKKATTRQVEDPDLLVRYLVKCADGDFVMEIKAAWKVTFGAVNPGNTPHGRDLHCLRVWEGERLRMVVNNVAGLRDLDIPVARKVQAEMHHSEWKADSLGNFEASSKRELGETTFVPEDPEVPAF